MKYEYNVGRLYQRELNLFCACPCFTNKRFLVTYFLFENKIVRTILYFYSLLLDVDV